MIRPLFGQDDPLGNLRGWTRLVRRCLTCGWRYDRGKRMQKLREAIRARYRVPSLDELRERAEETRDGFEPGELVW